MADQGDLGAADGCCGVMWGEIERCADADQADLFTGQ